MVQREERIAVHFDSVVGVRSGGEGEWSAAVTITTIVVVVVVDVVQRKGGDNRVTFDLLRTITPAPPMTSCM